MVEGYCVKCKAKGVQIKNPAVSQTQRGGYIAKGKCSNGCGTTVCAMLSKDNAEKAIKAGAKKDY